MDGKWCCAEGGRGCCSMVEWSKPFMPLGGENGGRGGLEEGNVSRSA